MIWLAVVGTLNQGQRYTEGCVKEHREVCRGAQRGTWMCMRGPQRSAPSNHWDAQCVEGVWRCAEGCAEVYRGTPRGAHGGEQRDVWWCIEVFSAWQGVQHGTWRCMEVCAEVQKGVWRGAQRCTVCAQSVCTEVHGGYTEVWRGVWLEMMTSKIQSQYLPILASVTGFEFDWF